MFTSYLGSECLLAAYQNCFKNYGINIDESLIYFLGGGAVTRYSSNKKDIHLTTNMHESIIIFCDKYRIKRIEDSNISSIEAEEILKDCINNNEYIIVKVSSSYLEYNRIYLSAHENAHFLVVFDYNDQSAIISDGLVPTVPYSVYQGEFSLEKLRKGREEKNNKYTIIKKSSLSYLKNNIGYETIKHDLINNIKAYLKRHLEGGEKYTAYFGVDAINKFYTDSKFFPEYFVKDYKERMIKMNSELKFYGVITDRVLLNKVMHLLKTHNLLEVENLIFDKMDSLIKEWNLVCFLLIKVGLTKNQKELQQMRQCLLNIIELEKEIYTYLFGTIRGCII